MNLNSGDDDTKNDNSIDFREALENLRIELINMINQLKDMLNKKADKDELHNLEQIILRKIEEVFINLNQRINNLANASETNKRLLELEKHVIFCIFLLFFFCFKFLFFCFI